MKKKWTVTPSQHLLVPVQEQSQEGVVLCCIGVRYNDVAHCSHVGNLKLR